MRSGPVPTARSLGPRAFRQRESGTRVLLSVMHVYLLALWFPVKIDAQQNPVPALLMFALAALLLWFAVTQARRRDARRAAGQGRRTDTWSRRPPRY